MLQQRNPSFTKVFSDNIPATLDLRDKEQITRVSFWRIDNLLAILREPQHFTVLSQRQSFDQQLNFHARTLWNSFPLRLATNIGHVQISYRLVSKFAQQSTYRFSTLFSLYFASMSRLAKLIDCQSTHYGFWSRL
jgi:hypothetical protein